MPADVIPRQAHCGNIDAAMTRVDANLSVMRFCSSTAFARSRSSRAMARLMMPIGAQLSVQERW
jgi:hypothetical protein